MISPIRRHFIRNWSNHHCINYNSMMTRCNPRGNLPRTTHENSNYRPTMRNDPIHCLRSFILRIILLSILSHKIISNYRTRINMTTYRNSAIQSSSSPTTKYSNSTCIRSNCNLSTPWSIRK